MIKKCFYDILFFIEKLNSVGKTNQTAKTKTYMQEIKTTWVLLGYLGIFLLLILGNVFRVVSDIFASIIFILVGADMFLYAIFSDLSVIDYLNKTTKKPQRSKSKKITSRTTFSSVNKNHIYHKEVNTKHFIIIYINHHISNIFSTIFGIKDRITKNMSR